MQYSKPSLKMTNGRKVVLCGFCRKTPHNAGDSVSELIMLSTMLNAMVSANWLYSCPVMPGIMAAGINTASSTELVATIGPATSFMARSAAIFPLGAPSSSCRYTFSTTIIESSTTKPMASTSPSNVSVLMVKPAAIMMAKVPTIETGMAIMGISVARQLCKKIKMTSRTNRPASISVFTRSSMEADTNAVLS